MIGAAARGSCCGSLSRYSFRVRDNVLGAENHSNTVRTDAPLPGNDHVIIIHIKCLQKGFESFVQPLCHLCYIFPEAFANASNYARNKQPQPLKKTQLLVYLAGIRFGP